MILLMLECLRFKGQKKLMRTSKHSPPRRGGEAAPKAPTGWRAAQARQGEASIEGRRQRYGFWFIEAERSFQEAARLDPNAAMGYWGIAMAAPGTFLPAYQLALTPNSARPETRARAAISKAQALSDSITPRERLYIEAVAARD